MAQDNAVIRYQRKNIIRKAICLNRNTDKDMIEFVDRIENFQGYIKSLIRKDMESRSK